MSKIALAPNASGTGTLTVAAPNTNSDYTLTLPAETGTVLTSASTVIQNGGPAFSAYIGSAQSLSGGTYNKLQFNTEEFDTASCYNTTTYRFTPNVAGYYQVNLTVQLSADTPIPWVLIYKNGAYFKSNTGSSQSGQLNGHGEVSALIYMNGTTDYLEPYAYVSAGINTGSGSLVTFFQAFLARAA